MDAISPNVAFSPAQHALPMCNFSPLTGPKIDALVLTHRGTRILLNLGNVKSAWLKIGNLFTCTRS
jgi:hypothetical protein